MSEQNENLPMIFTGRPEQIGPAAPPSQSDREPPASVPLTHYFWVIRKQAWKMLVFIATSLFLTYMISSRLEPVYESAATINIDRQAPRGIVGADAENRGGSEDADMYMATQIRIIQSDAVLRPVAEKFELLKREKSLEELTPLQMAARKDAPTVLKQLKVSRPTLTYLLKVSYRSTNPHLAADVANAVARNYLEHLYRLRVEAASSTAGVITRQLDELKAKMERSGQALAQFEKELNVISPEEKTNIISQRLLQLNTEYTAAQADRVKNEAVYNSLKSGSLEAIQASGQGEALERLQERINDAEEKFAEIRTSKGSNHPEYKKAQSSLAELQGQFTALRANVADRVEVEYRKSLAREQMLQRTLADTKAEFDSLNLHSFDYHRLKEDADADKKLYEQLMTKTQEAGINASFQSTNAMISDLARPGVSPVFPNIETNLLLAALLSSVLAIGAVIVLDSIDTSVRDPEQIHRLYQTDLLGVLPLVKDTAALSYSGNDPITSLSLLSDNKPPKDRSISAFEEAVRMLRNSVLLADFDHRLRSILFTSATPGEGKSTAALHLAISHAEQGKKTLLIDTDLRRPTLDKKLMISDTGPGIAGVLFGDVTWEAATIQLPSLPNLFFLPAGAVSRRAADLIGSSIANLLDEAVQVYDLVILDGPPMLGFAEAMQLAIAADGVVVVAVAGETNRKAIGSVISTLRRLRANVLGIILNRVTKDKGAGYYYYRYYDYYRYSAEKIVQRTADQSVLK